MDIEDTDTLNEFSHNEFILDPIEITLPSIDQNNEKSITDRKRRTNNLKCRDSVEEIGEIKSIAHIMSQAIETSKNRYIQSKVQKITKMIWSIINLKKNILTPLVIIKVRMPTQYSYLLQFLYESINENQASFDIYEHSTIIPIDQTITSIEELIEVTAQYSRKIQEISKKAESNEDSKDHCLVFLFAPSFNQCIEFLDDYMKYLMEEMFNKYTNIKAVMVFPSFPALSKLKNFDAEIVEIKFENTSKLLFKLILNLLLRISFVPFINTRVLQFLLHDFEYMSVSLERVVQKLHLLIQDYLFSIKNSPDTIQFIKHIQGQIDPNEEPSEYMKLKRELQDGLDIFELIEEEVFRVKGGKTVKKIISFLASNTATYQMPSEVTSSIDSYKDIDKICRGIENIFQTIKNDAFKFYLEKFIQLRKNMKNGVQLTPQVAKTAEERRQDALLSKSRGVSREKTIKNNIQAMKAAISKYIAIFVREFILGPFAKIEQKFPNLVFNDTKRLQKLCYNDLLEEYCVSSIEMSGSQPRKEVWIMFEIIQDFGLRIDLVQAFGAFKDKFKKLHPEAVKGDADIAFLVTLNELKWTGLINETKKSQIIFEKAFFPKTMFRRILNKEGEGEGEE